MVSNKNARIVSEIFGNQNKPLDAVTLMKAGVNPFFAWMYVRGRNVEWLNAHIKFEEHMPCIGLYGIPEKAPIDTFELFFESGVLELPSADIIRDICFLLEITPAVFTVPGHPLPARAGIVEAGILYAQEQLRRGGGIDTTLIAFMLNEIKKAEDLGDAKQEGFPLNAYMLSLCEATYDQDDQGVSCEYDTDDGLSPIETIRFEMDACIFTYQDDVTHELEEMGEKISRLESDKKRHEKNLWSCARALAPTEQKTPWVRAMESYRTNKKLTTSVVLEMLRKNPGAFHKPHPFWKTTNMFFSTGRGDEKRMLTGQDIVDQFCTSYRAFQDTHNQIVKTKEADKTKRIEAQDEYLQMYDWFRLPQTKNFLDAQANFRHIMELYSVSELSRMLGAPPITDVAPRPSPSIIRSKTL